MKRSSILAGLVLSLAWPLLAADGDHAARPEHGKSRAHGQAAAAQVADPRAAPAHLRKRGVQRLPERPHEGERLQERRERSHVDLPRKGPDRGNFQAKPFERREASTAVVREHFNGMMHDRAFLGGLRQLHRDERVAGRYYWHRWNNVDYVHYYDRWGYHWYGWTLGPRFLWVRSFGGRFWWFDADMERWCFWSGGNWWWPDPVRMNVLYVYDDGQYISSDPDEAAGTPVPGTSSAPPAYVDPKDVPPLPEEVPEPPPAN